MTSPVFAKKCCGTLYDTDSAGNHEVKGNTCIKTLYLFDDKTVRSNNTVSYGYHKHKTLHTNSGCGYDWHCDKYCSY